MTQLVSVKCQILVNFPGLEFLATEHKLRGIKNNLVLEGISRRSRVGAAKECKKKCAARAKF